jgi:hypothetical protein
MTTEVSIVIGNNKEYLIALHMDLAVEAWGRSPYCGIWGPRIFHEGEREEMVDAAGNIAELEGNIRLI